MTNVSAVEKMAELMQQMEENSPRVAAFQYCLKLVGNKLEEAEKRISELEARCAALAAENAGLKEACGGDGSYRDCPACAHSEYIEAPETPATDAFLAEVRAQAQSEVIEWLDAEITAIDTMYRGDPSYEHDAYWMKSNVLDVVELARKAFADELRKGVQS